MWQSDRGHQHTWVVTIVRNFPAHIHTWKIRDPATASQFQLAFNLNAMATVAAIVNAVGAVADIANHTESAWSNLLCPLLDAAIEVCKLTKKHQWTPETWWQNEQVGEAVQEKRACYNVYNALKKRGKMAEAMAVKTAIWLLKSEAEKGERGIHQSTFIWRFCFPCCQTDELHKTGCWWELPMQWCWWACAHWQRQDEGMGWTLCQATQCWA